MTKEDLLQIKQLLDEQKQDITELMDERFRQQEERIDEKFRQQEERIDEKFRQQEERFDKKLKDQKQDITELMDERFRQQDERFDEKLKDQKQDIIQECTASMNVLIESMIQPQFNLLAEGLADIQEKLVPRSRVDELEEEVKFMKLMYRQMAEDIAKLKKAQ